MTNNAVTREQQLERRITELEMALRTALDAEAVARRHAAAAEERAVRAWRVAQCLHGPRPDERANRPGLDRI